MGNGVAASKRHARCGDVGFRCSITPRTNSNLEKNISLAHHSRTEVDSTFGGLTAGQRGNFGVFGGVARAEILRFAHGPGRKKNPKNSRCARNNGRIHVARKTPPKTRNHHQKAQKHHQKTQKTPQRKSRLRAKNKPQRQKQSQFPWPRRGHQTGVISPALGVAHRQENGKTFARA